VEKELLDRIKKSLTKNGRLDRAVVEILNQEKDPYSIAEEIISPIAKFLPED
jgi:hypothetical protein